MLTMKGNDLLSTANLADGCMSAGVPFAVADSLRPLRPGDRIEGTALPVRHCGSVDIFLEAIERSSPGDVLVAAGVGLLVLFGGARQTPRRIERSTVLVRDSTTTGSYS